MKTATQTVLILKLFLFVDSLEIVDLVVPSVVESNSENVILDCIYSYEPSEASSLKLKWFLNENPVPFLVWRAGDSYEPPVIYDPLFEGKIDLNFNATDNPMTVHRSLMIHKPTVDMSGTYKCQVEVVLKDDDLLYEEAEANMLVFSGVRDTQFSQKRLAGDLINITCRIAGVFPLPVTKLTLGSFKMSEDYYHVNYVDSTYEILMYKILNYKKLTSKSVFGCETSLPGTKYFVREEATLSQNHYKRLPNKNYSRKKIISSR